jgi:hypothetical protein
MFLCFVFQNLRSQQRAREEETDLTSTWLAGEFVMGWECSTNYVAPTDVV